MNDAPTRAELRASSHQRSRVWLVVGAAAAIVAVVVVGVLLFAGGDDADDTPATRRIANTNVTLAAGEVTADSAGPPVSVSPETADAVIGTLGDYLEVATVEPLRSGKPAGDLAAVFDAATLARVTGVDRPALVDEGIPKVTGNLDLVAQPVAITGLGDQAGNLVALTATLDLDVSAAAKGGVAPLHIVRNGYFVLTPDPSGAWKVSAYRFSVTRDGGGIDVPATTVAGSAPATTGAPG